VTLTTKTFDTVTNEIIVQVAASLPGVLSDFNPGSITRTMIEALALQIGTNPYVPTNLYSQLESVYYSAYVDTATGTDLENLVTLVGVTRVPAVKATGVVTFYAVPAPAADIIIPAGTIVGTQPTATGTQILFTTDAQVTLLLSTTSITANITAQIAGVGGNVAISKVSYLSTPIYGITAITNLAAITGGVAAESDANLRIRAKHAVIVAGKATSDALYYAILGVAGVGSVTIDDLPVRTILDEQHLYTTGDVGFTLYQADVINDGSIVLTGTVVGAPHTFVENTDYEIDITPGQTNDILWMSATLPDTGTIVHIEYTVNKLGEVDAIVAGTTIPMPGPILAAVQAIIADTKAAGVLVTVIEPAVVDIDIAVTISVLPGYVAATVKTNVEIALTAWLDAIAVGYDVLLADVFQICQDVDGVYNTVVTDIGGGGAADYAIAALEVARPGTIVAT
jgi:uncharacterized phage protein gp47/JayE